VATARALAAVIKQKGRSSCCGGRQGDRWTTWRGDGQARELLGWPCAYWIMEAADRRRTASPSAAARQSRAARGLRPPAAGRARPRRRGSTSRAIRRTKGSWAPREGDQDVKAATSGGPERRSSLDRRTPGLPPRPPGRINQANVPTAVKELVRACASAKPSSEGEEEQMPNAFGASSRTIERLAEEGHGRVIGEPRGWRPAGRGRVASPTRRASRPEAARRVGRRERAAPRARRRSAPTERSVGGTPPPSSRPRRREASSRP